MLLIVTCTLSFGGTFVSCYDIEESESECLVLRRSMAEVTFVHGRILDLLFL